MIRTFADAVKFLESYIPPPEKKHPGELGLKRMEKLVELLDNPQVSYPTIHVGGTSGKGSTATIITTILGQKYKVGLHTSPHLEKINERIKTLQFRRAERSLRASFGLGRDDSENNISNKEFIDLVNKIYPIVKKVENSEPGKPSYFEIVMAMAFLHFQRQKVDIAVIEVGMGGRFDATNVIKPLVAVITNVGLDHTEVLGDTVEKIAEDKAGIIKPGIKVVSGAKQSSVVQILELKCKKERASLSLLQIPSHRVCAAGATPHPVCVSGFSYQIKRLNSRGSMFDYFGENTYRDLKISLLGRHQVENAAIALRAIELSNYPIIQLSNDDIRIGLSNSFIPARLEIVSRKPLVILDGAHNVEKMSALVSAIKDIFPHKKITAVIAIKSGKDAQGILKEILPICHEVIFTKFQLTTDLGDTFSYQPAELLKIFPGGIIYDDSIKAIKESIRKAKQDDLILVTGSLYLIGEIRKFLILNF